MIFLLSAIRTNSLKSGFKDGIPRLFGEKQFGAPNPDVTQGSPPPMRGKDREPADTGCTDGITPAYAGKSSNTRHSFFPRWDHPRLCGEKASTKAWELWGTGSPPPMRGKGSSTAAYRTAQGITPAYAGKSGA